MAAGFADVLALSGVWLGGRVRVVVEDEEEEVGGGHFLGLGKYSPGSPRISLAPSLPPGDQAGRARAQRRRRIAMLAVVVTDLLETEDAEDEAATRDPFAAFR